MDPKTKTNISALLRSPIFLFLLLFAVLSAIAVFFYATRQPAIRNVPTGTIYLTLVPDDWSLPQGIYAFDVETKTLERFFGHPWGTNVINGVFSPDGSVFVYASASPGDRYFQLHVSESMPTKPRQITFSPSSKKDPQWSPDGKSIAFVGTLDEKTFQEVEEIATEDLGVFVADWNGNETFITTGLHPRFSPDGKSLLVMKKDGLHLFDLATNTGEQVWGMEPGTNTYAGMKVALSADGSTLAWSFPNTGKVLIIRIESWRPFVGYVAGEFYTHAFWPVFSPDGKFVVAEEVNWGSNDDPKLILYDIEEGTKTTLLQLSGYDQQAMWVDAWR